MPEIDIEPIEVLMRAHAALKAEQRSKEPEKSVPHRFGAEIYAGAIVMMSSLMQAHVETVFEAAFRRKFMHLKSSEEIRTYRKSIGNWGNPNENNINNLFIRLGIIRLLDDFVFYSNDHSTDMKRLRALNEIRNKIAHGEIKYEYNIDGVSHKLSQGEIWNWKNYVYQFGQKFGPYVDSKQI